MAKELRETSREWQSPGLKKNTFDLSHAHPMTADLGKIYPVFTEVMPPNSSIHVTPSWSFKFRPFLQDMQTNVKAHYSLWRVPVRILWDNFKKFTRIDPTTANPSIAHPFISREHFTGVGTLADYFGIPCQSYSSVADGAMVPMSCFDESTEGFKFNAQNRKTNMSYGLPHNGAGLSSDWNNTSGRYRIMQGMFLTDVNTGFEAPIHGVIPWSITDSHTTEHYMLVNPSANKGKCNYFASDLFRAINETKYCLPRRMESGGLTKSELEDINKLNMCHYIFYPKAITQNFHVTDPSSSTAFTKFMDFVMWHGVANDSPAYTAVLTNSYQYRVCVFAGSTFADAQLKYVFGEGESDDWLNMQCLRTLVSDKAQFHPFEQGSTETPKDIQILGTKFECTALDSDLQKVNDLISTYGGVWLAIVGGYVNKTGSVQSDYYAAYRNYWNKPFIDGGTNTNRLKCIGVRFQTFHNMTGYVGDATKVQALGGFGSCNVYLDAPFYERSNTPFDGLNPKCPISALPFRAYEAVYNYQYRIKELDPFMKQGEICVDDWNTNHGDGADSETPIDIKRVSYFDDYFFGCLPKPTGYDFQQAVAGVTANGDADVRTLTFTAKDGTDYNVKVSVNHDGTIGSIDSYDETTEQFTIDALKEGIKYGITPQAVTYANALNKWYEATYKGGRYTYQGFIDAHFGHPATHNGLQNPEFIGGITRNLNVEGVQQSVETDARPLGYQASIGSFSLNDSKGWTIYTDEECVVLGLLYFTLEPINNQSIRKFWLRSMPSDYPTPELANLGTMEVLKKEIAPLQCDWDTDEPNQTFGYNGNYSDLKHQWDFASGLYRTDYAHQLFMRIYGTAPEISANLLKIRSEELSCPYADGNTSIDPLYGMVHTDCRRQIWLNQEPNQIIM